jgi:choline dehydrogenase-like flavoprotein
MTHAEVFDYVIVGGGTAGCVLASRLSVDPKVRVALLEAGPRDQSLKIRIPAAVAAAVADPKLSWGYKSVAQAHLNGRRLPIPRGKVLGGCSSINGMVYFRGHPRDFDDWAAAGAVGWSYQDVLPYFRRSENNEAWPASPLHGSGGPMNVIDIRKPNALVARFVDAALSLGYRHCTDFNAGDPEGFGPRQATIRGGRRESGVTAFLDRARQRPNLAVYTDTTVLGIGIDAGRARRVTVERGRVRTQIEARAEIILAAGAYGSPQLLLLSGVGPGEDLRALGIPVQHHLPGVGLGLHDHPATALQMRTANATSYGLSVKAVPRGLWNVLEYALARRGPLGSNVFEATGFVRSDPREERPDLQIVFMPAHRNASGFPIPLGHGYGIVVIAIRPRSRGTVKLAASDPYVAPNIDPNFLAVPEDIETLLAGTQLSRRILAASPFSSLQATELLPGAAVQDEGAWAEYIRNSVVTVHHPCSTCRMGGDDLAVVDPQLRVRGIAGLRVADASVFPHVVAGNSNAAVVMVAEKASDLILAGRSAAAQAA